MIGFAMDMDGTIYRGEQAIPGAREFVNGLVEKGIPFKFITNNSSHTCGFYAERLQRMGFKVNVNDVLTSTIATLRFIKENRRGKKVCVIATPEIREEIAIYGLETVSMDEDPDLIMLTYDLTLDYAKINAVYHAILDGAELVATHPDDLCPSERGFEVDMGQIIRLFENLTGTKATVVGKPNRLMLDMAALEMGVSADDVVIIGDRLTTDIRLALNAGVRSILVLTGETDRAMLESFDSSPTYVMESLDELNDPEVFGRLAPNSLKL